MARMMKNPKINGNRSFFLNQEKSDLPTTHFLMIENTLNDANHKDYIGEDEIDISKPIYHFS